MCKFLAFHTLCTRLFWMQIKHTLGALFGLFSDCSAYILLSLRRRLIGHNRGRQTLTAACLPASLPTTSQGNAVLMGRIADTKWTFQQFYCSTGWSLRSSSQQQQQPTYTRTSGKAAIVAVYSDNDYPDNCTRSENIFNKQNNLSPFLISASFSCFFAVLHSTFSSVTFCSAAGGDLFSESDTCCLSYICFRKSR